VLFLLFGSSAAGKTFALDALRTRKPDLAIHDFDEIGVPLGADTAWRQRSNELWIQRALDYQTEGVDLLLAGQTPVGELLASPSAPLLHAISACLIDCDDQTRVARLRARGPEWLARSPGDLQDYLNWAEWMRRHSEDPNWRPDVIRVGDEEVMRWERWSGWHRGDSRWRIRTIDTSALPVAEVADQLSSWIEDERAQVRAGTHPLLHWADQDVPPRRRTNILRVADTADW
jgi:hypothetical protein